MIALHVKVPREDRKRDVVHNAPQAYPPVRAVEHLANVTVIHPATPDGDAA